MASLCCVPCPERVGCSFVAWAPAASGQLSSALKRGLCSCASEIQGRTDTPSPNFQNGWKKLCYVQCGVFYVVCFRLVIPSLQIPRSDVSKYSECAAVQHSLRPVRVFLCHCCRSWRALHRGALASRSPSVAGAGSRGSVRETDRQTVLLGWVWAAELDLPISLEMFPLSTSRNPFTLH